MKKNHVKFSIRSLVLACAFAAPMLNNIICQANEQVARKIILEFIDTKGCQKSFEQIVTELVAALSSDKQNQKYKPLCTDLAKLAKSTNVNIIGMTLMKHRNMLPTDIQVELKKLTTEQLKQILAVRTKLKNTAVTGA